jgi:hypothetical protein
MVRTVSGLTEGHGFFTKRQRFGAPTQLLIGASQIFHAIQREFVVRPQFGFHHRQNVVQQPGGLRRLPESRLVHTLEHDAVQRIPVFAAPVPGVEFLGEGVLRQALLVFAQKEE